ncbi:MAG TPA: helix-turn-helix domain-containing protein [Opitutaceae bacterium]|nr:helix-turn-helix domain-containing protein [Opitutaceae bacterium]
MDKRLGRNYIVPLDCASEACIDKAISNGKELSGTELNRFWQESARRVRQVLLVQHRSSIGARRGIKPVTDHLWATARMTPNVQDQKAGITMNTLPDGDRLLLLTEVAEALRVSHKTVRRLLDEGKLKSLKVRGRILVRASELMIYVNAAAR